MRLLLPVFLVLSSLPATADDFAPMALNSYTLMPSKLSTATVYRQDGSVLGNVQGAEQSAAGIGRLRIGVPGPKVISLGAADISYDAAKNMIVTDDMATKAALGPVP